MDQSRAYILERLKSKKTTVEEFNYDKLTAPPITYFLSPYDIQELHNIATSIKLSSKLEEKYKMIDDIMVRRRGMVRFGRGTNRVVYKHPEFPNILFKVAYDAVALKDNPAEFRNQQFLKPFVCKVFEVSPCGTVALVEKCNPISSREEYLSIADDIYMMLQEWFIGRYVLSDIGSKYFMNVAIRPGFQDPHIGNSMVRSF